MKMLLIAVAMTIATPAFAQTAAPVVDPHAGHAMPADHAGHTMPADHADHEGCCEKTADGKMKCRDEKAAKGATADPHAGHDMSPE